jgi:hypothetical protein
MCYGRLPIEGRGQTTYLHQMSHITKDPKKIQISSHHFNEHPKKIQISSHNFNKRSKMITSYVKWTIVVVLAALPVLVSFYQHGGAGTSLEGRPVVRQVSEKKEPALFSLFDNKDFDGEDEDKYQMVSSRTHTFSRVHVLCRPLEELCSR